MCDFEKKVLYALRDCGVNLCDYFSHTAQSSALSKIVSHTPPRLGVAVSGGADSVSLLLSLSEILFELKKKTLECGEEKSCGSHDVSTPSSKNTGSQAAAASFTLYVISVNHNIRPAEESGGDADFVFEVCENLRRRGLDVVCNVVELERGAVDAYAKERGCGTEAAARDLRYAAFERFIAEQNLGFLCLAHNRNDQLETLLMRFLQGSTAEAAAGIKARRGLYIRPLLCVERSEIEAYVASRGFSWRTDKTNYETDYLRNKIRLNLVPFLNQEFPFWQTGVLSGAEKSYEDSLVIQKFVEDFPLFVSKNPETSSIEVKIPLESFISSPAAIQRRVLLSACNKIGETSRIPNHFLSDVINCLNDSFSNSSDSDFSKSLKTLSFSKHFASVDIIIEKNNLFVKKHKQNNTDCVFFDIIEESGNFSFPFGNLNVFNLRESKGEKKVSVCISEISIADDISLPFCVRSVQPGDLILCADGSEKKVSDILSDWHIESEKKLLVPVIQLLGETNQPIKAVLARFLGYKDWIVKL
ncbi:MAG: tRNA lysidine(34) synthetase TilS [Treponema sp.]|nr:tRNA lysidine(34) synthetase TilS [Treponema sp.]